MDLLRQTGRRNAGGLLMLGIVETVVIGTGILLVIPGLWILSLWAVAMPAMIVEGTRVGASFKRSIELTRGARWRIVGAYLAWVMILIVFLLLAGAVVHVAFGLAARGTTGSLVAGWIAGTVLIVVLACLPAVLYVLLRVEKEATTPEQIAASLGERPG